MPSLGLSQFQEVVTPFWKVFDKLSVACCAVRVEGKWISLYTRITLSHSLDVSESMPQLLKIGIDFVAIFLEDSPQRFDVLLKELDSGSLALSAEGETFHVFTNKASAGLSSQAGVQAGVQFYGINRPLREYAKNKETFRPTIEISANGNRIYEILSNDDISRISKYLRTLPSPVNGLQGLLRAMGSTIVLGSSNEAQLEVNAVLPFDTTVSGEQVEVRCPEFVASRLSAVFFLSPRGSERSRDETNIQVPCRSGYCIVSFPIPWRDDSERADAHVFYDQEEIEKFTVRHWRSAANWRLMVDNDFDPGAKLLSEALKERKKSNVFEQAVVRLLTLGGIPANWYGESRESGKSDLAVFYEEVNRRIVILGECTLDKPQQKVASLKFRAESLQESLGSAAAVLPVIFTACDPLEDDYSHAAKAGIALVGRDELTKIFQLIQNHARPAEIVKLVEDVISSAQSDYPLVARWQPRYEI
jgi:hypothetical protein